MKKTPPLNVKNSMDYISAVRSSRVVVHLVHGTFARNAAWTQEGSFIRGKIEASFPANTVSFSKFGWTGANSHRQRLNAAIKLGEHLVGAFQSEPAAAHFIIAHSHGGNVALQALSVEALAQRIAGVVCLATPYLHCRPRNLSFWVSIIALVMPMLCSIAGTALLILALHWFSNVWSHLFLDNIVGFIGIIGAIIAFLLAAIYGNIKIWRGFRRGLVDALATWIWQRQYAAISRFCLPNEIYVPLLSVKMAGDEAELFLQVVRGLSHLPLTVATFIGKALVWLIKPLTWVFRALFTLPELSLAAGVVLSFGLFLLPGVATSLAAIVLLVCAPLIAFLPQVVRAHKLGFGEESIIENIVCDLYADDVPPVHSAKVGLFHSAPDWKKFWNTSPSERHELPIHHSLPYLDPDALECVADWMKRRCCKPFTR
jgi:hypothetical protein